MRPKFCLLSILAILGCSKADFSIPFTNQNIFRNTEYIQVPSFEYKDEYNGKTYTFHGTCGDSIHKTPDFIKVIPYNYFDTISSHPAFSWAKTNSKYVMVAIFNERISIDYEKNQIRNINSIVWAWNTGMGSGLEGEIGFNNGCDVVNGIIQYNLKPTPLGNGQRYILAIWAWDENAKNIVASSREIPFVTETYAFNKNTADREKNLNTEHY
jgi:hypothetical protein